MKCGTVYKSTYYELPGLGQKMMQYHVKSIVFVLQKIGNANFIHVLAIVQMFSIEIRTLN